MNALIVYAHLEPASFNAALKDAAVAAIVAAGHQVEVSDLYGEQFNPVAGRHDFTTVADPARFHYQGEQMLAAQQDGFSGEIKREHARVNRADVIILQFPLWWGAPPAILKGWFERVLAYGFAYADGRRFDKGLFRGRGGLMCVTTGGTPARFSAKGSTVRSSACCGRCGGSRSNISGSMSASPSSAMARRASMTRRVRTICGNGRRA